MVKNKYLWQNPSAAFFVHVAFFTLPFSCILLLKEKFLCFQTKKQECRRTWLIANSVFQRSIQASSPSMFMRRFLKWKKLKTKSILLDRRQIEENYKRRKLENLTTPPNGPRTFGGRFMLLKSWSLFFNQNNTIKANFPFSVCQESNSVTVTLGFYYLTDIETQPNHATLSTLKITSFRSPSRSGEKKLQELTMMPGGSIKKAEEQMLLKYLKKTRTSLLKR